MSKPNFLNVLLIHELDGLYDAEKLLWKALPRLVRAAQSRAVRETFSGRLTEAQFRMKHLEDMLRQLEAVPGGRICRVMNEIVARGEGILRRESDGTVRDCLLAAVAGEMEQHETAGYGLAQNYAVLLGYEDMAQTLGQLLQGELPCGAGAEDRDRATIVLSPDSSFESYDCLPASSPFQLAGL